MLPFHPLAWMKQMTSCTRKELLSTKGEGGATPAASSAAQTHGRAASLYREMGTSTGSTGGAQLSPKPSSSWLLDKKPFSLLQGPSSRVENSVKQNPEEFSNYTPITSGRCIQERTGQVIQLKNDCTATIATSLSILVLQLVIAAT